MTDICVGNCPSTVSFKPSSVLSVRSSLFCKDLLTMAGDERSARIHGLRRTLRTPQRRPSACSILVDIPATCDNMRPKSCTVLHQASASIPSISKMAGYSAGVEPCLPATVLGCEDTPLIDSRILLSFGYRPENDVCPQASPGFVPQASSQASVA